MISRFERFYSAIAVINRCVLKIERVEMAKYGLKAPHTQCILAMGQHPEGITAARLCEICEKDKAAISRTVAELETAGMICRSDPEGKRYRSLLRLTEQGTAVAHNISDLVHRAVRQASEGYVDRDRDIFVNVLTMIAGNLESICQEGLKESPVYSEEK